jgi:2-polyprenyl-3-methyl-5-hydroxy-6-metoxy-1,4-benzoquinol methylase
MDQTPVNDIHNEEVLRMIPPKSKKLIDVGCSSGALAREYKKINADCHYIGLDIVESYARLATRFCDEIIVADIEKQNNHFFDTNKDCDCWIFADTLEHLVDPWLVLKKVRQIIPVNGHIVACIPNAQNWSVVANLAVGNFRYQDSGLLDKTHLRWFTRETIIELFDEAGFAIEAGNVRVFEDPNNIPFLPIIGEIAKFLGVNGEVAMKDSIPFQYVVRAVPK